MTISAFSDELAQVRTKKKEFLTQIERIVPWKEWLCLIQPFVFGFLRHRFQQSGSGRRYPWPFSQSADQERIAGAAVRVKVEHVFGVVKKKQLCFRKTRYRGLEKQRAKFNIMFALANLILADRPCLAA